MTDVDRDRDAERRVREELRTTLVPPPTPAGLFAAVDRLALDPPRRETEPARWRTAMAGRRGLQAVLGLAAAVALAVGALASVQIIVGTRVGATPPATLPAVIGSALPSSPAHATLLASGAWIDESTAWTIDLARNLRLTEDGGQTWSEPRPMVQATDLGFGMLDANHGYVGWAQRGLTAWALSLYRTSDGGRTWDPPVEVGSLDVVSGARANLMANVHFADALHGVFLATARDEATAGQATPDESCVAFASDDGGIGWTPQPAAPCMDSAGVLWASATLGVLQSPSPRRISVTQDGGRTWTTASAPTASGATTFTPMLVARSSDGTLRILGSSFADTGPIPPLAVYESRDAGTSWEPAYLPGGLPRTNPGLVWALDGEHWLGAAEVVSLGGMNLYESQDAGVTWTTAGHAAMQPGWMRWFDRLHGVIQGVPIACNGSACGGDGTILLTNDGGQSWHQVPF